MTNDSTPAPIVPQRSGRWVWLFVTVVLLILSLLFFRWVYNRSMNSAKRQRDMRQWVDNALNTDGSFFVGMEARLNLAAVLRLTLHDLEVEHPNVLFPGKFITTPWVRWRLPLLSTWGMIPGQLTVECEDLVVKLAQDDSGEWNVDGLFGDGTGAESSYPFGKPAITDWQVELRNAMVQIQRNNSVFEFALDGSLINDKPNGHVTGHFRSIPFLFRNTGSRLAWNGTVKPNILSGWVFPRPGGGVDIAPDFCEVQIENMPLSALRFFSRGMPVAWSPVNYAGLLRMTGRLDENGAPQSDYAIFDGKLEGAAIPVLGLIDPIMVKGVWPFPKTGDPDKSKGIGRLGPGGFGGADIAVSLDATGVPQRLEIKSDVGVLDELSPFLSNSSPWGGWLASVFREVEWVAGEWRGFGWSGQKLAVQYSSSTGTPAFNGTAEMGGGRMSFSSSSAAKRFPYLVVLEDAKVDSVMEPLMGQLPEEFRFDHVGGKMNVTWRGSSLPKKVAFPWEMAMVISNVQLRPTKSGAWWSSLGGLPMALAEAARGFPGETDPDFSPEPLEAVPFEQISLIIRRDEAMIVRIEVMARSSDLGEIAGWMECDANQSWSGEISIRGKSRLVEEAAQMNSRFGAALRILAGTENGIAIAFSQDASGKMRFDTTLLNDALKIDSITNKRDEGDGSR